jgi:hypothetical protein
MKVGDSLCDLSYSIQNIEQERERRKREKREREEGRERREKLKIESSRHHPSSPYTSLIT